MIDKKDRQTYEHLLDVVEKRVMAGKARFGDHGLMKYYKKRLCESD